MIVISVNDAFPYSKINMGEVNTKKIAMGAVCPIAL